MQLSDCPGRFLCDRSSQYWIVTESERAELNQLRLRGGQRPPQISWGDWKGPRRLTWLRELACHLRAAGAPMGHIAWIAEVTQPQMSIFLSTSLARLYVWNLLQRESRDSWKEWARVWGYWNGNSQHLNRK